MSAPAPQSTPDAPRHLSSGETGGRRRSGPILRVVRLTIGSLLLVVGVVVWIMPIPLGFLIVAGALYLLASESETVRTSIRGVRRRLPALDKGMRGMAHRLPRGVMHMIRDTDPHPPAGPCCRKAQAEAA